MNASINHVDDLVHALIAADYPAAARALADFRKEGGMIDVADRLFFPALGRMGGAWEAGSLSLSHLYMGAHICEELIEGLVPEGEALRRDRPRIAAAVLEDYHSLGKRMVCLVLRSAGYDVADYGQGLLVTDLLDRLRREKIDLLLLSALTLSAAQSVKHLTTLLKMSGASLKVVVGGPVFSHDRELWKEIGADAVGTSAGEALGIVGRIAGELL